MTDLWSADDAALAHADPAIVAAMLGVAPLDAVRTAFRKWLGEDYDLHVLEAVLAVAASEQLGGDPAWLLVVSGSGDAKTETVQTLAGAGATVTSTITSEGALLSATPRKDTTKGATGGLLRKLGDSGILVVKDFTSILSMNRDSRAGVLAALREVYDGRWERNVGTDGGRSLLWEGRLVVIGAVTTAWDSAHHVIAAMGDRFVLVRGDSTTGRVQAGRNSLANVGHEKQMRAELAAAVGKLLDGVGLNPALAVLQPGDDTVLLGVANIVTLMRTAVEMDYKGDVVDSHAPEMPTRFAKMLGQVVRGHLAIGATHEQALDLAMRVAGDSAPPLRLAALDDIAHHPSSRTSDCSRRLQKPRATVDRALQALHVLGLVEVQDSVAGSGWRYDLAEHVERDSLERLVTRNVSRGNTGIQEVRPVTDISGNGRAGTHHCHSPACDLRGFDHHAVMTP